MNGKTIPHSQTAKYFGIMLDAKLRWEVHVKKKREEFGLKYKQMYWLMGRQSALSTHNKLVFYIQNLKPFWTYDIQLWGCTKPSNTALIQKFQNKILRNIVDAPWYVRKADLHRGLKWKWLWQKLHGSLRREASPSRQRRSDPADRQY